MNPFSDPRGTSARTDPAAADERAHCTETCKSLLGFTQTMISIALKYVLLSNCKSDISGQNSDYPGWFLDGELLFTTGLFFARNKRISGFHI